ncbi:DUF2802 domain-containing protein [Aestuariibacter halophilus]|uniref:DUF2802 domain-containing protein n=1 Tax=Fluctibacter halophilus TaxID=226011 RepID=A0ABS8G4K2_9ALTE|nr:DUF2802 domain-containing protein [Aestuariibacter halophilus]MCC2614775.1 DUF2802 domain-containing protein [Aestuariibacter halophilus]
MIDLQWPWLVGAAVGAVLLLLILRQMHRYTVLQRTLQEALDDIDVCLKAQQSLLSQLQQQQRSLDSLRQQQGDSQDAAQRQAKEQASALQEVQQQLDAMSSQIELLSEQSPEQRLYRKAERLLADGASVQDIVDECEIPRGEAEMLFALHQAHKAN